MKCDIAARVIQSAASTDFAIARTPTEWVFKRMEMTGERRPITIQSDGVSQTLIIPVMRDVVIAEAPTFAELAAKIGKEQLAKYSQAQDDSPYFSQHRERLEGLITELERAGEPS